MLQWLQITPVPSAMILIGAYTWSCIRNSVVCTGLWEEFSDAAETTEGGEVLNAEH
jgi:hypothetical protein